MSGHDAYRAQSIELSLTPPETPPRSDHKHTLPSLGPEAIIEEEGRSKRRKVNIESEIADTEVAVFDIEHQNVLLLHGVKQRYAHTKKHPVPRLENDREMLIAVEVVGLNPIDWKAPYVSELYNSEKPLMKDRQGFWLGTSTTTLYQWPRSCWQGRQSSKDKVEIQGWGFCKHTQV